MNSAYDAEDMPEVWLLLGLLGATLGGAYGWLFAERYAPAPISMTVLAIVGAAAPGWLLREAAEAEGTHPAHALLGALLGGGAAAVLVAVAGHPAEVVALFAFIAFIGGIGVAIHPWAALWGTLIGVVIGVVDLLIEWIIGGPPTVSALSRLFKTIAAFGLLTPTLWATYHRERARKRMSIWD